VSKLSKISDLKETIKSKMNVDVDPMFNVDVID